MKRTYTNEKFASIKFSDPAVQRVLAEARRYKKQFENVSNEELFIQERFEDLVRKNMLFAIKIAAQIANSKVQLAELIPSALEGLYIAAKAFDPSKGKFTTFAYFKVKQECLIYLETFSNQQTNFVDDLFSEFEFFEFSYKEKPEVSKKMIKEFVLALLLTLPEQSRYILKRIFFDNMPKQAIADELGISPDRVQNIKNKALIYLKQKAMQI